ncbi:MAG TPA: TolC family protein [Bacteroidota bacterium]|nr:TolC family protein [Bacteroidota bacterium]
MKRSMLIMLAIFVTLPALGQQTLTLDESKRIALENNARVKNSLLDIDASRQVRKAALTRYFPSISAGGAKFEADKNLMEISTPGGNLPVYNPSNPMTIFTTTQFAYMPASTMGLLKDGTFGEVTAAQPIFAGGRIWNGNRLASLGEDVSEYKNNVTRNDVLLQTEERYWLVVSLTEKEKTLQRYEALLNSLLTQVEDAYKSGVVSRNDLLKVRVKRSEVHLNRSKLENGRVLALMSFCQHLGVPYDSTLRLADTLNVDGSPQEYYVDHESALKGRSEYRLLDAMVRAEELQTGMKLGEYLPEVAVGVTGLYMKLDQAGDRRIGMVFGTVSIPISGWWEASHTLQERSIKEEMAVNTRKESSDLLLLQMQKAYRDLIDAYQQVHLSEEALSQADENLRVNQDSYNNGMSTVSDLLEAEAMQQQSNDHLIEAKADYRKSLVTYLQVTGR